MEVKREQRGLQSEVEVSVHKSNCAQPFLPPCVSVQTRVHVCNSSIASFLLKPSLSSTKDVSEQTSEFSTVEQLKSSV